METTEVTDFNKIIDLATNNGHQFIYRGQSKEYNNLIPGIYRDEIKQSIKSDFLDLEPRIMQTFKTYSSPFGSQTQLPEGNEEWLFLAQHHGVPTRLLDWSGNALIALFFAVVESPESNGELWSLNYEGLNHLSGAPKGVNLKYSNYKYLIEDVFSFHDEKEDLRKELKIEKGVVKPLAAFPYSLKINRLERQSGCFTIHPFEGQDIVVILKNSPHLQRFVIPAKKKREFELKLAYLGVSHSSIYPDFYGLAEGIKRIIVNGAI